MKLILLLPTLLLARVPLLFSQSVWSIELGTGSAYSFSTTLKFEQTDQPEIRFSADFQTRPWQDAPYYEWRISRRTDRAGWELEFLHHKLYLKNNPPEVQHFEVTHGYNLLLVNRMWKLRYFDIRVGGGVVIAHTESDVRNLSMSANYDIAGIAGQVATAKRLYLSKNFFVNFEGKLTFASATVSVANGDARVPNIALHGLVGVGYDFR
jgi:hypothetical protein